MERQDKTKEKKAILFDLITALTSAETLHDATREKHRRQAIKEDIIQPLKDAIKKLLEE
jgi:hypothetical protein